LKFEKITVKKFSKNNGQVFFPKNNGHFFFVENLTAEIVEIAAKKLSDKQNESINYFCP